MKSASTSLLVRGALATVLLALGLARLSQWVDPVMNPAEQNLEPAKLAGPVMACHLIEKPAEKVG
ncbi:hypothetical protein ASA1KI_02650 [Opitutales bacterium ASA1]|jgi:hypothetical protein|uniref:hypothetical protein n=1 Tax=Congregicoccus parvus TaxID=3081749 RepID=UPI002B2908BA|nr:hypothetical protein ASA1KI_02650 [Opitutales bacterium ASA1]